jgi:hypothetical protein
MHFYRCTQCGKFGQCEDPNHCPACGAWIEQSEPSSFALPRPTSRPWLAVVFVILGIAVGLLTAAWSIGIGGAGHGWFAPARISWIALFAAPLAALAWAYRTKHMGIWLARGLLILMLLADAFFMLIASGEDPNHFSRTWNHGWFAIIAWAALWLLWQEVVIVCIIANERDSGSPETNV